MNEHTNVVTLDRNGFNTRTRAQQLIDSCEQLTLKHLNALLQRMLDNADDTLFEMADKAENNTIQTQYFDAMRELRIMRKQLEDHVVTELKRGFQQFRHGPPRPVAQPQAPQLTLETMSLVDENELEESLAVTGMVQKINNLFSRELYALEQRALHLCPDRDVTQDTLPFGPQQICDAFRAATQDLDSGTEIKLIILKLFDNYVTANIGALFQELNHTLIQGGILPDIRVAIPKPSSPAATPALPFNMPQDYAAPATDAPLTSNMLPAGNTGYPPAAPDSSTLASLQQLLIHQRGGYTTAPLTVDLTPAQPHQPAAIATSDDLITALSSLQHQGFGDDPASAPTTAIRTALSGEIARVIPTGAAAKIDSVDNDVIDIVAMLFDTILEDRNLPTTAKALIGQLQIPIIKVAIADKEFFNKKQHPARKLLNELARHAVGLDEHCTLDDNPTLMKIADVVQRIQNEFEQDTGLFAELLSDFMDFVAEEAKRETISLNDARAAIASREHEQLANAWVTESIVEHINERDIPRPVYELLIGPWKDVMLHTYLEHGENCSLWNDQTRFIDLLMWSVIPKHSTRDKKRLTAIIQQLIRTLRESLTAIDYPQHRIDELLNTLQCVHLASLRGETQAETIPVVKVTNNEHTGDTHDTSDDISDLLSSMQQQLDTMSDFEKMLNEPLGGDSEHKPLQRGFEHAAQEQSAVEEITLEELYGQPTDDAPTIEDEFWEQACMLKTGRWVTFTNDNGKTKRLKLAWKSEMLGECTFVNWKFQVELDISLAEFAHRLRNGHAAIVDDLPLFERAMDSVYNRLTKSAQQSTEPSTPSR